MTIAACGSTGSDEVVPLTGVTPTTTTVVITSSAAAVSTTVATATTLTQAPMSTAVPTTSEAPPGTTTPEQLRAEIRNALSAGRALELSLKAHPPTVDLIALAERYDDDAAELVAASIQRHIDNGTAVRPAVTALERIELISLNVVGDDAVVAVYCLISDAVVYQPASGEILDDSVGSLELTSTLVRGSGGWRESTAATLSIFPGEGCR